MIVFCWFERLRISTGLMISIGKKMLRYFGNIERRAAITEVLIGESKDDGKRSTEGSPRRWLGQIKSIYGSPFLIHSIKRIIGTPAPQP